MHADSLQKCIWTCIWTCINTYTYTNIHVHIHMYTYINIYIYTYTYTYTYIYTWIHIYIPTHIHVHIHIHICICICTRTCMVLNNTCERMLTLCKNAYGLVRARLYNGAAASLPWKLLRTYLESCANIVQAVVYRLPSCRSPSCWQSVKEHCSLKIRPNPCYLMTRSPLR